MRKLPSLLLLICALSAPAMTQTLSDGAKLLQGAKIQRVASGCGTTAPCTGILDDFNRAGEGPPLSASWSEPLRVAHSPGWAAFSNTAVSVASASTWWNATQFNANQEAFFDSTTTITFLEIPINITSPGGASLGAVSIYYSGTQWEWYEYTNNTGTGICTPIVFSHTSGDKFWLRRDGTTLTFSRVASGSGTWSSLGTCTESAHNNAGYIGIITYGGHIIDNFGGGNR